MPRRRRLLAASAALALGGGLLITPLLTADSASAIGGLTIAAPFNGDFPIYGPTFSMNGYAPNGDPLTVLVDGLPHACDGILPIDNGLGGWDWFCNTSAPGSVPLPGPHTLEVIQDRRASSRTLSRSLSSPIRRR